MSENNIASFLKQLRKTSGYSANSVVEQLKSYGIDISAKTLYGYESGLSMLNADAFVALCRIYKCDNPMDIFGTTTTYPNEIDMIEKYRTLDTHGTEMVDYVLGKEFDRCQLKENQLTYVDPEGQSSLRTMQYYQRLASAGSGEYLFDDIPTDTITVENTPVSSEADFIVGVNGKSMEPTYSDGELVFVKKASKIPIGEIGIFTKGSECFIKELGSDRLISHNADKARYPDIFPDEEIRLVGAVLGKAKKL